MRKIIFSIILTIIMLPSICFAEPIIKSDSRTFDIIKGVYDLRGNVFVQFPVHGSNMTITGDMTKVYMYQQEVHGSGNITLSFDNMKFEVNPIVNSFKKTLSNSNFLVMKCFKLIFSEEGQAKNICYSWQIYGFQRL